MVRGNETSPRSAPKKVWGFSLVTAGLVFACGGDPMAVDVADDLSSSTTNDVSDESTTMGTTESSPSIDFCEGPVRVRYDGRPDDIDAFPDDLLTEEASTATGVRVRRLHPEYPLDTFGGLFDGLATLDGFGTSAPAFIRLVGPIDPDSLPAPGIETDPTRSTLLLIDLDAPEPELVAFDWRIEKERGDGTTLFVEPLRTLAPGTRYGLVLTRGARDPEGGCIAPSAVMRALLGGDELEPVLGRLSGRYRDLLDASIASGAIEGPADVSAAITFTTQTTLHESTTIATAIKEANPPPLAPGACAPHYSCIRCDVTLTMADFRDADGVVAPAHVPQDFYEIPVSTYLPLDQSGPFPTVIFGHGLGGDRTNTGMYAPYMCAEGYAVVGIDAPKHGDHPNEALINPALDLMGITGDSEDPFLALHARDNFRQATYDKLQLLRRIEVGMDVTGDGQADFDFEHVHYYGASLGAVMAAPFLAFAPEVRAAILVVGGVRLTNLVSDSAELVGIAVLVTTELHRAERARFMAMAQAALDRGDPEVFAGHVLHDRIEGFDSATPQILAQMAMDDAIVPNSSTAYLARNLGIPIVGEPILPIREVDLEPRLPLAGNLAAGHTGGLFQFTEVLATEPPHEYEPASHYNVQGDPLAREQRLAFLRSIEQTEGATIIDPFAAP